jgi:hypothetical protein
VTRISLEIERLVLDGVTLGPGGAERVRRAAAAALAARIAADGLHPALLAGGAHGQLDGEPVALALGQATTPSSAARLGGQIGGAVAGRLSGRSSAR